MGINNLLDAKKTAIIDRWFELVMKSYAHDAAKLFKNRKADFTNPVGANIYKSLEAVFNSLLTHQDRETISRQLDMTIRIRAVQDFTPAEAVGFIFALKPIIRDVLSEELKDAQTLRQVMQFESQIDELSLIAFTIYMECKSKIYNLKSSEERNRIYKAFERAGLVEEIPENQADL